ncbi:Na+ driven multidrug efflux pump [Borrelia nietonii YOR]|uniref:Multidrug-efflux transporter n=1 Tax=Borrelia nietonii YOR TaxID=1293576 RepID=A0ABM5PIG9_9SPIR|nr:MULTISPECIES: MATE family efflux transporter [Borrelia]AHH03467.1 Na+ driven multidrug efflux pump [Borrelia nietonii YOR]AHH13976.1 Na+ driven multidrug efflux pump [Borrelia hermsii MTW]UPA09178.1 MATE family efflux transporter [Borrelia nietonii YOR]
MLTSRTKIRKLILEGNLYRVLLVISFPIVATNVFQAFYELVDMFYVGKLGAMPLAALSLTGPINFLIMVFAMGMATGSVSLMSRCIGEETFAKFSKYAGQLIFLNFVLSLFVTVLVLIFIDLILDVMGVSGELKELTKAYFYVVIYAIPIMFLSIAVIYILNAQGETVISMILILVANIINFILDPILMFTCNLGIAGAAWSTLFAKLMTVVSYLFFTYRLNCGLKVRLKDIVPDIAIIIKIVNLGLPAAFGQMMASLSFLVLNYIVIRIGSKFLAAYGMANNIISFLLLPGMSIGTGIVSIVGQNLGAKNISRVGDTLKKGFLVTLVIMLTIASSIISFREIIIKMFTDDLEVFDYANRYLLLTSIGTVGFGLQQVFFGGLIGVGLTKLFMIVSCIRLWIVRLPVVFIFQYFGVIEDSLGYAFIISHYVALIIVVCLTFTRYWTKIQ